jgi:hypothetical protein
MKTWQDTANYWLAQGLANLQSEEERQQIALSLLKCDLLPKYIPPPTETPADYCFNRAMVILGEIKCHSQDTIKLFVKTAIFIK